MGNEHNGSTLMLFKVQDVRALQINTEKKKQKTNKTEKIFNSNTHENHALGSEI